LPTHALAEEIPEDDMYFLTQLSIRVRKRLFTSGLKLKIFQQHHPRRSHICVLLITNFLKEKILDKKILAILLQFAKFAKIFSLQNFVSYGM